MKQKKKISINRPTTNVKKSTNNVLQANKNDRLHDASKPKKKKAGKRNKKSSHDRSWLKFISKWLLIICIWGMNGILVMMAYYVHDLPDMRLLDKDQRPPSITMTAQDANGDEVTLIKYGDMYGEQVDASELPEHLIQAVMATEDRRFFDHSGVDFIGIARAFYQNIKAQRIVQGGSTITQQLAKNVFLNSERTFKRKIQEMFLASWLEQYYSKNEILTFYLNRVYLGAGNYGIDAAAHFYFDKSARELSLSESAVIAGLLKAPSKYAPTRQISVSQERANQVLQNMINAGYITRKDIQESSDQSVMIHQQGRGVLDNLYVADWIMENISGFTGHIPRSLSIETTINSDLQAHADQLIQEYIEEYGEEYHFSQGALIAMRPTGEILAMNGGKHYQESQFNRAVQAYRQPGSLFKFFVYLTAFERNKTPSEYYQDQPITIQGWSPKNYNNKQYGRIMIQQAFAESVNRVSVAIARDIGIHNIIHYARELGVNAPMNADLSLALGTASVNLLEMVQAYAHMANDGFYTDAFAVKKITDSQKQVIYEYHPEETKERIISPRAVAYINQVMQSVMQQGTGKNAYIHSLSGGKTGTSQNSRDAWFIGYTSELVVGIWLGNDDNSPMKGVTGGNFPAKIWHDFMLKAENMYPADDFPLTERAVRYGKVDNRSLWQKILDNFGSDD